MTVAVYVNTYGLDSALRKLGHTSLANALKKKPCVYTALVSEMREYENLEAKAYQIIVDNLETELED